MNLDKLLDNISKSGEYKILKKYKFTVEYNKNTENKKLKIGSIVDGETTGLDTLKDELFSIGLVQFTYDDHGNIYHIRNSYTSMSETVIPISQDVQDLTQTTNEMIKGKKFNYDRINALLGESDIIIAHNAGFDRPFFDRYFPISKTKVWADSQNQVPWVKNGLSHRSLPVICMYFDFFYTSHNALQDCLATLHICANKLNDKNVLSYMLDTLNDVNYHIKAIGAAFDKKDILRARGYRWDSTNRYWGTTVDQSKVKEEHEFLVEKVYDGSPKYQIDKVERENMFKSPS